MRLPAPTSLTLPWPLPALGAWALAWSLYAGVGALDLGAGLAFALAAAFGGACAWTQSQRWRRLIVAGGFPASALALGLGAALPAWAWLLPLAALALAYPARAWRDAPLFPTPQAALDGLADVIDVAPGDAVLDAGCGLGHGLDALRAAWPGARLEGVEWSWPIALACRLRARLRGDDARVRQGDMWAADWSGYRLVYLFQRPESMGRAVTKAQREMRPGSWLVSLEFEAPQLAPHAQLRTPDGRALWVYRVGGPSKRPVPQISRGAADKPRNRASR